jgi:hypothetical protein
MLCHGNPDQHCCWVNGVRCSNLLEGPQILAAVEALITQYNFQGPLNNAARLMPEGITFACHVALKVMAAHLDVTGQMIPRSTFETNWAAHPDYDHVADAWEAIGKPRDWCPKYGPAEGQCCFSEPEPVNATKANGIPVSIKNLRSAIGSV